MLDNPRTQRIRDPLHNLIEFDACEFESTMWRILQTQPFQRLRRIRQLGFSEFVYPGATHTRFAHSVGVFHTARRLMTIIQRHLGTKFSETKARRALAAALVHDLGHGPFSHAFEEVGKKLGWKLADHEAVSEQLIRNSEVADILKELGSGFADDVAEVIKSKGPRDLYDAVVSSQFDADRLDYMRRDRLMSGTQHGAIDFEWLMANLEVGHVPEIVDDQKVGEKETFVLGPKATYAAETYVLGLFQLYPTIYFHKATRGVEKMFSTLLFRLFMLVRNDNVVCSGLPDTHPLVRFARDPDKLGHVLALDDTVILGALPMLIEASDPTLSAFALRLRDRKLLKCVDLRERVMHQAEAEVDPTDGDSCTAREDRKKHLEQAIIRRQTEIKKGIEEWSSKQPEDRPPRILVDEAERDSYTNSGKSNKGPLNQIRIRLGDNSIVDVATCSPVIATVDKFRLFRVYFDKSDNDAQTLIHNLLGKDGNDG